MNVSVSSARRLARVWWRATQRQASWALASRLDFCFYILGKLLRMAFFFVFALALFHKTPMIAGFDTTQVVLFFGVMNLLDVMSQMMFMRGFQLLEQHINSNEFDVVLTRPLSPLVWTTMSKFDLFDLVTLPASVWFVWYAVVHLAVPPSAAQLLVGTLLFAMSLCAMYAMCILCGALAFYMTESFNVWWLYRDMSYAARNPQEFFPRAVQHFFVFVIPIFVVVAYPTRAVLGLLTWWHVAWAVAVAASLLLIARAVWYGGIKRYSSVSS